MKAAKNSSKRESRDEHLRALKERGDSQDWEKKTKKIKEYRKEIANALGELESANEWFDIWEENKGGEIIDPELSEQLGEGVENLKKIIEQIEKSIEDSRKRPRG